MRVIEVALERFTERGDAVVVDIPAYPPVFEAVAAAGRILVPNSMRSHDGWRLNLPGLARAFEDGAVAYLLCNPHNPTGRVFTDAELRAVLELAARHRAVVFSDEVHAPLVSSGYRHIPIASLAEAVGVPSVTAMSASKGWNVSGLKCAMAVPGSPADMSGWWACARETATVSAF